eukprot:s1548_g6.t1
MKGIAGFFVIYFLVVLYINHSYYGFTKKTPSTAQGYSEGIVASAYQGAQGTWAEPTSLDPQGFGSASFQRSRIFAPYYGCNVYGRCMAVAVPMWTSQQEDPHSLPYLQKTLVERFEAQHNPENLRLDRRARSRLVGFCSADSETKIRYPIKFKEKAHGKRKRKERWCDRECSTIAISEDNAFATLADYRDYFRECTSATTAALAAHAELVSAVRQNYPDMSKAPSNIQMAVKKADQNLSKQIGSDLHKASSQIEKASKQLTTLRSARAKHKEAWLKHLRDSVETWEGQIKAFQEQQKIYSDQIGRAKMEISQARRSLQTVSKHAGNVTVKAELDSDNMEDELEADPEEQVLALRVQELLQQSANLAIPPEVQEIHGSDEEAAPASKRQRSLEPFSHLATPTVPAETVHISRYVTVSDGKMITSQTSLHCKEPMICSTKLLWTLCSMQVTGKGPLFKWPILGSILRQHRGAQNSKRVHFSTAHFFDLHADPRKGPIHSRSLDDGQTSDCLKHDCMIHSSLCTIFSHLIHDSFSFDHTNVLHDEDVQAPLSSVAVLSRTLHDTSDEGMFMQVSAMSSNEQLKSTPCDNQQSDLMAAFASGHADPEYATALFDADEMSGSDREPDESLNGGSSESHVHPPSSDENRQDVVMFHLQDEPLRAFLDWSSYSNMIDEIARHFLTTTANVVDAYEINAPLGGLPPDSVPIIVHLFPDVAVGQNAKLVLFDVDIHGHCSEANFRLGPTSTRSVLVVPERCDRSAILVLANVDRYCRKEAGKCIIWHNSRTWYDWDLDARQIVHGDYIKIAIPPTERCVCSTVQIVQWTQEGLSDSEIIDRTLDNQVADGYSPSLLDQDEVRALARQEEIDDEDTFQALQLSSEVPAPSVHATRHAKKDRPSLCGDFMSSSLADREVGAHARPIQVSLTDEIIAYVSAANNAPEDAPEFPDEETDMVHQSTFVQDLWEKWTDNAVMGPGNVELMAKVETWFTDHVSLQRCMVPRTVVLTRDYGNWERQILAVWMDVASLSAETSYHLVYPKPEDASPGVFAQVVIVQHPNEELRSLVISIYDSQRAIQEPFSFCHVLPHRVGIDDVLAVSGLSEVCSDLLPQNECSLWYGTTPIRVGQRVFVRSGYALRLSVRRGTLLSYQQLMSMSDAQLRAQLQDAPHVEVYRRPSWPAFSGDVYAFHDQDYRRNPPAEIEEPSQSSSDTREHEVLPEWILALRRIFEQQAKTEDVWEGPFIDILVWFLHGQNAESCRVPKVVRLDRAQFTWRTSIIFATLEGIQRGTPTDIFVVHPSPPRFAGHTHAAHVLVTQMIPSDLRAVLMSTNPVYDTEEPRQFAYVVPRRMSAADVRSAMASSFRSSSCHIVWRGQHRFHDNQPTELSNGDGIVIEPESFAFLNPAPMATIEIDHDASAAVSQGNANDASFQLQHEQTNDIDHHESHAAADDVTDSLLADVADSIDDDAPSFLQVRACRHESVESVVDDLHLSSGDGHAECVESSTKANDQPCAQYLQLHREIEDDAQDVTAALRWSAHVDHADASGIAVSLILPCQRHANIVVPDLCDVDVIGQALMQVAGLLMPPSDVFPVPFRRHTWNFSQSKWYVASFQKPMPEFAIVLGVRYSRQAAYPKALTLPRQICQGTLRQVLSVKAGSLIRLNGIPITEWTTLTHGDVLEFHACPYVSRVPSFSGKAVQISLDATLPIIAPPFRPDMPAELLCDKGSWPNDFANFGDTKFAELPEGVHLEPCTFEAFHLQERIHDHTPAHIELFVDGSAKGDVAAWAVVAVSFSPSGFVFQGCMTGLVELNPASSQWIGAKDHTSTDAELTAMAVAQTVALQISDQFPVVLRPDLAFSSGLANRSMTSRHDYSLPKLVHLLGQWCTSQVCIEEVRGHAGNPWNELADQLAKHTVRVGKLHGRAPTPLLRSIVCLPDDLKWAWLQNMPKEYSFAMPQTYDKTVWQPSTSCHAFRSQGKQTKSSVELMQLDFSLVSLNVLSIVDEKASDHNSVRCLRLDQQFHAAKLAFLCLQETRTAEGQRITDHYRIFASGREQCAKAVHFGCEVWISKCLPLCTGSSGQALYARDFQITVLHSSPRCIAVKLTGPITVVVVSAHAPCDAASRENSVLQKWWHDFEVLLSSFANDGLFVCGIDANAPISGPACDNFGAYGAETATKTGELFQAMLLDQNLFAPATFDVHQGPSGTWRHPRGSWHRRDYILVNECTFPIVAESRTITDVDTGFGHVDHIPVMIRVCGAQIVNSPCQKPKWDYDKLQDPICQQKFQDALYTLPMPNWNVDIEAHSQIMEGQIMQLAQQCFAPESRRSKSRPVLQRSTIDLISLKRQALGMFRLPEFSNCQMLKDELKLLDKMIRPKVAADQQRWYDEWLRQIEEAGDIHDHRTMFSKLQRLGRKKKAQASGPRPLPMLKDPSGDLAKSFSQCQEIFCAHFASIEAGMQVDEAQLCQLHRPKACLGDFDAELCPSPYDLFKQIRKMKNRKAPGPGGLVIEVLKAGGEAMCHHLAPMLTKAILHQQEPLHWKSGLLVPLFKGKGATTNPNSYRSIFLSDCIAKVHHGGIRQRLVKAWATQADVIQYGGKAGHSTDLAHHLLSAFVAWGRASQTSVGMLFVDLQSAFYSVLRQSFFDDDINDSLLCQALQHHGVFPQDWHHIRAQIEKDVALQHVGEHAQGIIQDMFTASHFSMAGVEKNVCTMRGTRPGDPVADVMFNMVFYLVLRDTRQQFEHMTGMNWLGSPRPPHDVTAVPAFPSAGFCDVSFVDDAAYCVYTEKPDQLGPAMRCLVSCLHDVARLRGLTLNYSPGKTEAMLHFAGPGSRKVKSHLWHDMQAKLPVVTELGTHIVNVAHEYKHLGSFIQDYAVNSKDARLRVAQARQAAGQLQRSFFRKRNISVDSKATVFRALVMSRHLFQVHTWSWITQDEVSRWSSGLRSCVSLLIRDQIRPIPAFKFSIPQMYAIAGLNAPEDLLHANRLRYLARMITTAPVVLWQLLHYNEEPHAWSSLIMQSASWLCTYSPRHVPAFSSLADLCSYVSLHGSWTGLVKATLKSCLGFHAASAKGLLWALRMEHFVQSWSDYSPPKPDATPSRWQCGLCEHSFESRRALAMHSRQVHKYSCFPPADEQTVDQLEEEDRQQNRKLKASGWKATKAFVPVLRIPCAVLPPPSTPDAELMRSRWNARVTQGGEAFNNLVGYAVTPTVEVDASSCIVPFLGQTFGGKVLGHGGVFQRAGLAALQAQIHIKTLVFVHFYSGYRRFGDLQWQIEQFEVREHVHLFCLSIDLCLAKAHSDLTNAETKTFWLKQIRGGNVLGVGGGPPCETWTAARLLEGGPPPVRSGEHPWGVPGLTKRKRIQVDIGSQLLIFLGDLLAEAALAGLCGFAEHPAYPTWAMPSNPSSIWTLPALRTLAKLECVEIVTVDQCLLGHEARKPTTLLLLRMPATARDIRKLGAGGRCNHMYKHQALKGIDKEGNFRTSYAKIYPIGLNQLLAQGIFCYLKDTDLSGHSQMPCEMRPLISEDFCDEVQADYHR